MPDPIDDARAEQLRRYDEGVARWHDENATHLTALEIANCTRCDPDGYTPARRICDHQDRTDTVNRGRALVQAELDKIRQRKLDRTKGGAA